MQINRNNYEAYFLDYWERNLNEQYRKELSSFLENNPDLQDAFYDYSDMKDFRLIPDENVSFGFKNQLKKETITACGLINSENYETFVIASLEGDLTKEESIALKEFIKMNPSVEQIVEQYSKAYLKPPVNVVFQEKEKLKRNTVLFYQKHVRRWLVAAAATLIVGVAVFYALIAEKPINQSNRVAQKLQPSNDEEAIETKVNLSNDNQKQNVKSNWKRSEEVLANEPKITENKIVKSNSDVSQTTQLKDLGNNNNLIEKQQGDIVNRQHNLLSPLIAKAVVLPEFAELTFAGNLEKREEWSMIFDDLLLRDAMKSISEKSEVKRSAFERILANLGGKIINGKNSDPENKSLVSQIATRGKETISGLSNVLPVYRTYEDERKKETFLALTENFTIYRSKTTNESKPEKIRNQP